MEGVVVELLLTNGGIGLLDKRMARPQYQYERRWLLVVVCARACERRVRRHARMMRGDDMAVVSRHNYIRRSIVLCQRNERHNL